MVELPEAPLFLGVFDIQARSVVLQFIPGFHVDTPITRWIVEAQEVEKSADYREVYQVHVQFNSLTHGMSCILTCILNVWEVKNKIKIIIYLLKQVRTRKMFVATMARKEWHVISIL